MSAALITGCNGGLGVRIMQRFASQGYDIIACSISESEEFLALCIEIESDNNIHITHIVYDSTCDQSFLEALSKVESYEDEISILVNNAGINIIKPLFYTELEDLRSTFAVNYFSAVMMTKSVAAKMIRQNSGSIVNISSIGSFGQQTGGSCYDASKAALNQFTKSIAQELSSFGVRVNAIAPAPMNTPMFANMPEKTRKNLVKNVAFKRAVEPEEVVDLISFLCSNEANFITGQIIRIDGGAII